MIVQSICRLSSLGYKRGSRDAVLEERYKVIDTSSASKHIVLFVSSASWIRKARPILGQRRLAPILQQ